MGNNNVKEEFSLFNNIKIPIITVNNSDIIVYYNENFKLKIISDLKSDIYEKNVKVYDFYSYLTLIDTYTIDCRIYKIYTYSNESKFKKLNSFIIDINKQYHFKYVSESFCNIVNLNREYIMNNTQCFFKNIHPVDKLLFDNKIKIKSIIRNNKEFIWNGRIKINSQFKWFKINGYIDTSTHQLTGILIDITDIKNSNKNYEIELIKNIRNKYKHNIPNSPLKEIILKKDTTMNIRYYINNIIKSSDYLDVLIHDDVPPNIIINISIINKIFEIVIKDSNIINLSISKLSNMIVFLFLSDKKFYNNELINILNNNKINYNIHINKLYIKLPYTNDRLNKIRPAFINTNKINKKNNIKIILIDDNKGNQLDLKMYLISLGYSVTLFNNIDYIKNKGNLEIERNYNCILIYRLDTHNQVYELRKRNFNIPIILGNPDNYIDSQYTYLLDYPFSKNKIKEILITLSTKINILYIDTNNLDIISNTNILEKVLNYNVTVSDNINIKIIDDYQLILIDESSLLKLDRSIYTNIKIPTLLITKNIFQLNHKFFSDTIKYPFSVELFKEKINLCLSKVFYED